MASQACNSPEERAPFEDIPVASADWGEVRVHCEDVEVEIEVREKHIGEGKKNDACLCPISLAIRDALARGGLSVKKVETHSTDRIRLQMWSDSCLWTAFDCKLEEGSPRDLWEEEAGADLSLPNEIDPRFAEKFDAGEKVHPFRCRISAMPHDPSA